MPDNFELADQAGDAALGVAKGLAQAAFGDENESGDQEGVADVPVNPEPGPANDLLAPRMRYQPRPASMNTHPGQVGNATADAFAASGPKYGQATQGRSRNTWASTLGQVVDPAEQARLGHIFGVDGEDSGPDGQGTA